MKPLIIFYLFIFAGETKFVDQTLALYIYMQYETLEILSKEEPPKFVDATLTILSAYLVILDILCVQGPLKIFCGGTEICKSTSGFASGWLCDSMFFRKEVGEGNRFGSKEHGSNTAGLVGKPQLFQSVGSLT